jgi:pseudouridine synthase
MTHPRYSIEKEYLAKVKGQVSEQTAEKLRKGIVIEGKRTLPAKVTLIHYDKKSDSTQLRIILHEGRKRQIRNMCKAVSHPILSLKRVRIGFLTLKGMAPGMCHILTKVQVEKLKRMVNLT